MRYYYRANDGKGFLNLKTPLENKDGYTQITEDETTNSRTHLNQPKSRKPNSRKRGKLLSLKVNF